mgnify:CR=1 FL=1
MKILNSVRMSKPLKQILDENFFLPNEKFHEKFRQIEVRFALLSYSVNKVSRTFSPFLTLRDFLLNPF